MESESKYKIPLYLTNTLYMCIHNLTVMLGDIFKNSMQKAKKQAFTTREFSIWSLVSMRKELQVWEHLDVGFFTPGGPKTEG